MTAPVLADALGPRARRRVRIATVVGALLIAALVLVALRRFASNGQLDADLWRGFTQASVLRFLAVGLVNTLKLAAVSMAAAVVLGALLALGRLARNAVVRMLVGAWVEFFRGVPLLLLILFSALGLPKLGIDLPLFWYVVLGLVLYNSAVLGEIFRAGILSLDRGQGEAASAIGLTYWSAMRLVIVPQAARRMIPSIVSQLVTLLKDTSLAFVVSYEELLRRGQIAGEDTTIGSPLLPAIIIVAAIYVVVNYCLGRVARRLEVRQRRRYKAGAIDVSGIEDLATLDVDDTAAPENGDGTERAGGRVADRVPARTARPPTATDL